MSRQGKLEEIRQEIADGKLLRAMQRLSDMARNRPFDTDVRDLLGLACFEAGEKLTAARHWFLSPRQDVRSAEAMAFLEKAGEGKASGVARFLRLPPEASVRVEDPVVRARLSRLEQRLTDEGLTREQAHELLTAPRGSRASGFNAYRAAVLSGGSTLGCLLTAVLVVGTCLGLVIAVARWVAGALS